MYIEAIKLTLFIICILAIIILTTITHPISIYNYNNSHIVIVGAIPLFLLAFVIASGVGIIIYNYYFSDDN